MGAGESSWSRWTKTSAVEGRAEIEIFGNKNFFKKKRERGHSPQAGPPTCRLGYQPQASLPGLQAGKPGPQAGKPAHRQVSLVVLFYFYFYFFYFFYFILLFLFLFLFYFLVFFFFLISSLVVYFVYFFCISSF